MGHTTVSTPDGDYGVSVSSIPQGIVLEFPHREGCWTEGKEKRWMVYGGTSWNRAVNGRRGGAHAFHRFRCNDPDCPAVLMVRYDVLSLWLTDLMP